jgi:DNA-binding MarR family transcriptional regulator
MAAHRTRRPDLGGGATPTRRGSARLKAQFAAYVAVLQAAEDLQRGFAELLKRAGLSPAQYNVLRVLRGAGPAGLACGEVGAKLIRHDPDITRLFDRLERRGLVERSREARDRRVVVTRITEKALGVLATLDDPVDALHERQLGHLSERQLGDLAALLQAARGGPG